MDKAYIRRIETLFGGTYYDFENDRFPTEREQFIDLRKKKDWDSRIDRFPL